MKALKTVILTVLSIPVLILSVSLFLPSSYRVERSLEMRAKPDAIFAQVSGLKNWTNWTAWTVAKHPDMEVSFSGPESGVGATYTWDGKSTGHGVLKLTRAEPDKGIGYDLAFDHGKYVSKGAIEYSPVGDGVRVTWSNEGELGWNPISRIFGLLMDRMMGPDFEEGLRNLKQRLEAK